jgi:hypothetical protein
MQTNCLLNFRNRSIASQRRYGLERDEGSGSPLRYGGPDLFVGDNRSLTIVGEMIPCRPKNTDASTPPVQKPSRALLSAITIEHSHRVP